MSEAAEMMAQQNPAEPVTPRANRGLLGSPRGYCLYIGADSLLGT